MPQAFLIDSDTASDDAVALIMALRTPEIEVKGVTIVSGNVSVEQGIRNALYTMQMCDVEHVPVYRGADKPLLRLPARAEWFHGVDGMGDQNYPAPKRSHSPDHAIDAIIRIVAENPGIVLVTLGPLTNIALAVLREPGLVANVSRCVVMGGTAWAVGNVTPAAEFNIWQDPEAARIVFHSGLPIEMVGWELCRFDSGLFPTDIHFIRGINTPLAHFSIDCNRIAIEAIRKQSGALNLELPDPVAMAVAIDPAICTRKSKHSVEIETQSELTRGMTIIDQLDNASDSRNQVYWQQALEQGNVTVCWEIDIQRWKQMLFRTLGGG